MIIEYALLVGAAGVNAAQLIALAARKKQKLNYKESTDKINSLRAEVTDLLVELGDLKVDCSRNEIKTFFELHEKLSAESSKKLIFQNLEDPLLSDSGKTIISLSEDLCNKIDQCKNKDLNREKVSIALGTENYGIVFQGVGSSVLTPLILMPVVSLAARKSFQKTFPNPTIAWITFPLFSEKVNHRDNSLIFGGTVDEVVLAATNHPHSLQAEKEFRRILKEEEKRKELGSKIEEACIFIEEIKNRIKEVMLCIKEERKRLSEYNARLSQIIEIKNETEYAYSLSESIIRESIYYLMDLVTLIRMPFVDYYGNLYEPMQSYLGNEEFQQRVVGELNFHKFDHYYRDYVDIYTVKETNLSDYNIKIIKSDVFSDKAKFMFFYNSDSQNLKWTECSEASALCYDKRFTNFTVETMEALVKQISEDMALGIKETSIYFLGDKTLFDRLEELIIQKFKATKTIYMGDGVHEE